jgi:DNA-directed RNA polymerase specialized sigma24 family protein
MKAGETWALAALYERHAPVVYGYCRNLVKDQVKAEALLEESFFKFWQHRSHLRSPINGALDCLLALAFQVAGGAHQKVLERN